MSDKKIHWRVEVHDDDGAHFWGDDDPGDWNTSAKAAHEKPPKGFFRQWWWYVRRYFSNEGTKQERRTGCVCAFGAFYLLWELLEWLGCLNV